MGARSFCAMIYENYEGLIKKLALKYSQDEETFENLMSVGREAFCKTLKTYDKKKASFITILYQSVSCAMIDEYRKNKKHDGNFSLDLILEMEDVSEAFSDILPVNFSTDPARITELSNDVANLSEESQAVLRVVFDCTEEIYMETNSLAPKYLRGALTRVLRDKKFKWDHISNSFNEIKQLVSFIGA